MKRLLILFVSILMISCAALKKTDTKTEIRADSTSTTNVDKIQVESGSKETTINYTASNFQFEPFDNEKPFFIDGKEYKNVKGSNKTEKEDKKISEQYERLIRELIEQNTQLKQSLNQDLSTKEKDYSQVIETVSNKVIWLIAILFILFQIISYLKRKLPIL